MTAILMKRPILVTGCPRSGTTWVGSVLAHAPGVAYIHEPFNPGAGPFTRAPFVRQFQHVSAANEHLYEAPLRETLAFYFDLKQRLRTIARTPGGGGPRAMLHALKTWAAFRVHRLSGWWRALVKDPIALLSAEWLAERFDMEVVVLVRHPAGFVSSALRHHRILTAPAAFLDQPDLMDGLLGRFRSDLLDAGDRSELERAILQWRLLNDVVDTYRKRHPSWIFLRHEDLCADPEAAFQDLGRRLGVHLSAHTLRVLDHYSHAGNAPENDTTWDLRRDSRAIPALWKTRLTEEQVRLIRARTADVADRFYAPHEW